MASLAQCVSFFSRPLFARTKLTRISTLAVCHPTLPVALSEPLQNLFQRLAQHSRTKSESPLLESKALVDTIIRLGADHEKLRTVVATSTPEVTAEKDEDDAMDLDPPDFRPATPPRLGKVLSVEQRASCVERWCRIVEVLSAAK